jgi:hypothetical protein
MCSKSRSDALGGVVHPADSHNQARFPHKAYNTGFSAAREKSPDTLCAAITQKAATAAETQELP